MLNHRIRILSSLLVAFIIVNLYGRLSTGPLISPIQADNIKGLLSHIKFPTLNLTKLFTLQFNPDNNLTPVRPTGFEEQVVNFNLPTVEPQATNQVPTGTWQPSPTLSVEVPTEAGLPTEALAKAGPTRIPTNKPKPTATPAPVPITSDTRPGTSLSKIFQEVNKRECIPTALLMAFKTEETGERFKNDNAETIKIYNTYGWWKTGAGNPCYGYGYHGQTGIVPPDSVNAGASCNNAIGDQTDIGVMGIMEISEWEEQVSRKYTISTLPKNIDRRVLFDNTLIFAIITKNRVGQPPTNCDDWPDKVILIAAEKHLGVCQFDYNGHTGNYCTEVLNLYKQYK